MAWCLVAGGEAVSRLHDPVTGTRTNTAKTRNRQVATGVSHGREKVSEGRAPIDAGANGLEFRGGQRLVDPLGPSRWAVIGRLKGALPHFW